MFMLSLAQYRAFCMLEDILNSKKCFKLVCAAGNEDAEEVERLVYLYSMAGASFFDVCAKSEIVDAAKSGIMKSGIEKDRYICVSVGTTGDPHISKARILPEMCKNCAECAKICLQEAIIFENKIYNVKEKRCIGCGNCIKTCSHKAIELYNIEQDISNILPSLIQKDIDCVELHACGCDDFEVFSKWEEINKRYKGMLSICIDRSNLGNKAMVNRLKKLLISRKPYSTIIQADGSPMSGFDDDFKTTLQAVATAEIIQNENMPVYIMLSGGTNSKTAKLAQMCGVNANGVAIGSYARKIVRDYIVRDDFYTDTYVLNDALQIAKKLVDDTLSYMGENNG